MGNEFERILRDIEALRREVRSAQKPQLGHSSIENGSIDDYDADGSLRTVIGRQHDGTHTIRHVDGPVPPQPTPPTVEVDGPVLRVAWDGQFAAGEQVPEDFSRVDVHVAASGRETVAGNLGTREGSAVVLKAQQSGMHTVTLVARSLSGKSSPASEPVEVDVTVVSFSGAIEAVQLSADGKNVVTYATVPPTAEDAGTEGDTWWVNEARLRDPDDPASEEYIAITEQWRHDGTQWVAVELAHEVIASVDLGTATVGYLHGQRIVASTIDTEQLRSTAIDGMVITGATVQTSHEHPKTMMDPDGVHVTDEDGQDLVYLGRQIGVRGADGETLAQISDEGVISGHALNIEDDPVFMGTPLLGSLALYESTSQAGRLSWLDDLARGTVAHGVTQQTEGRSITNGEMALGELQFDQLEGRQYRVTVEPLTVQTNPGASVRMRVRYTWDGTWPGLDSPELKVWWQRPSNATGNAPLLQLGGSFLYDGQSTTRIRMLLTIESDNWIAIANSIYSGRTRVIVEDVGAVTADTGLYRATRREAGVIKNPDPVVEKRNYTKTYWSGPWRSFYPGGGHRTDKTDKMYQGRSPTGQSFQSIALFPSMLADLSGATITSVRAYFYFEHWYYSGGGSAKVMLHNQMSLPSNTPGLTLAATVDGWPKPGGRWVDIPSRFWGGFKSGIYRGVGLGDDSPSTTEYGIAHGPQTRIEVKYRK